MVSLLIGWPTDPAPGETKEFRTATWLAKGCDCRKAQELRCSLGGRFCLNYLELVSPDGQKLMRYRRPVEGYLDSQSLPEARANISLALAFSPSLMAQCLTLENRLYMELRQCVQLEIEIQQPFMTG